MKNFLIPMMFFGVLFMPLSIISQESDGIEEVIVTAEKKESNLQDVPTVIDVLTASQIEDMNITTTRDVDAALPSLIVNYNIDPFNASMRIRGIGTSQSDASLESDVALVVDGVYLNKSGLGLNDLIDIERIEVISGPQGTLYGKNTNAGVVNITTKTPLPGESDGFISYENGDFNSSRIVSALSFSVSDSTAIRLSASVNESDGYMTNITDGSSANGYDDSILGIKIYHQQNENLSYVFTHNDSSKDSTCCAVDSVPTSPQMAIAQSLGLGPINGLNYKDYTFSTSAGTPGFTLDSTLTSLKVDQERENGTLTLVLARNEYDSTRSWDGDHTAINFATVNTNNPGESFTTELRFSSNMIGNKEYTVGLFFSDSEYSEIGAGLDNRTIKIGNHFTPVWGAWLQSLQGQVASLQAILANPNAPAAAKAQAQAGLSQLLSPVPGTTTNVLQQVGGFLATTQEGDAIAQDMTWSDKTSAVFGRMTVHVSDSLRYTLGARYTNEEKEADLYANTMLVGTVGAQLAGMLGNPQLIGAPRQAVLGNAWPYSSFMQNVNEVFSRDDSSTTWSASIQKDLSEDIMIYASAATGYKAGGFNSTSGEDDMIRGYQPTETENFEIGIKSRFFDNKLQINATAFDMETEAQQYVTQRADGLGRLVANSTVPAERLGLDLNVVAKLRPNLTLNMSYLTIDDGAPAISSNAQNRLTPDDAYTVGLSHFFPLGNGNVFSRIDYSYDGSYEYTSLPSRSPQWLAVSAPSAYPEFARASDNEFLNYKIGWRNDNLELAYSVKNATDNHYIRLILQRSGVSGVNGLTYGTPEYHNFSIKYNF